MANWQNLKDSIASVIRTNGNQEITGQILQDALKSIISNVGMNYSCRGYATPTTNPGSPDGYVYYFAYTAGTYSNFDGAVLDGMALHLFFWHDSAWEDVNTNIGTVDESALKEELMEYVNKKIGDFDEEAEGTLYEQVQEAKSSGGGGVSSNAISLFSTILNAAVYTSNQKTNISKLITALAEGGGSKGFVYSPVITITGDLMTISCKTSGASIYYTIDGTEPSASSKAYSNAVTLSESCTIKAIAIKGENSSIVTEKVYDKAIVITPPTISVSNFIVTLSADEGMSIYYTTNGSTPTTDSKLYTEPFIPSADCTIMAIAVDDEENASAITSQEYTAKVVINFADSVVKSILVANYDTDNDGEISPSEAQVVTSFGGYSVGKFYNNTEITSFEEFEQFTGFKSLTWEFSGCSNLKKIKLPNTITKLGQAAFMNCTSLEELEIPSSVTTIESSVLKGTGLYHIVIPDSVTNFNTNGAFESCTRLIDCVLPDAFTKMPSFYGCTNLESVNIPSGVTTLGNQFANCNKLVITEIPKNVTTFESSFQFPRYGVERKVKILAESVPSLAKYSSFWDNGTYNTDIYVVDSLIDSYATADQWSTLYDNGKIHKLSEWTD